MRMTTLSQLRIEIDQRKDELAKLITEKHYALHPELDAKYGPIGREKCEQDARYHLSYLAEAVGAGQPGLFGDYAQWARFMLEGRGIPVSDLIENLKVVQSVVTDSLSTDTAARALEAVNAALEQLTKEQAAKLDSKPSFEIELPCRITQDNPLCSLATDYLNALLAGDRRKASELIMEAVKAGTPIKDLYLHVFQPSQHEVGRLWQINKLSVAQEHYCTAATQLIMSQLYPYIFSTRKNGKSMVATCVSGDLHEIGVRMISDFFEMEGWDTFYLGANVPVDSVLKMLRERQADLLAISATMTYHIDMVRRLIDAVRNDPSLAGVQILVGGYPFNIAPGLWKEIGANGHAHDAEQAVKLAQELQAAAR
jgi:MerR family transcriptional regulator, light-induced transcriptional regulator